MYGFEILMYSSVYKLPSVFCMCFTVSGENLVVPPKLILICGADSVW